MFRTVRHLIGAGTLTFLTAVAVVLARFVPEFWFSFYTDFSRGAVKAVSAVTGLLPFPLWEILLVVLVLSVPIGLVYAIVKRKIIGWLAGLLELAVFLVFLFVGIWGLNHFAPTIGDQIGLEVREYTTAELAAAARYYAREASDLAPQVPRDAAGDLILPEFDQISDRAVEAYDRLGESNDRFAGAVRRAKPLLVSEAFAYMGTTGVFVCYTGEATVSTETFAVSLPFTLCHELGHSLAVAAEDQANYCGFLACRASDDPVLRYSGYYNAFIYCYNALYKDSATTARKLWDDCSPELLHDCGAHVEHNKQYEGPVQEVAQSVNDSYLKAFDEPGVQSYGLVVDYLIADYLDS